MEKKIACISRLLVETNIIFISDYPSVYKYKYSI
jgi:hypothetical protein